MKKLQKFEEFKMNENVFQDIWRKTVELYQKKFKNGAWRQLLKFLVKKDELPKGVEVYFADGGLDESLLVENTEHVDLAHVDQNISNEDADEIQEAVRDAYNYRISQNDHSSIFFWGAPGIGKTEIVIQVGKELGLDMIVFHLSQIEPTEFRGVPTIENIKKTQKGKNVQYHSNDPDNIEEEEYSTDDERTVNKLPIIFPTDNGPKGKGGILFLDELNRAPKMVLSAALPLCLDGKIGDYELPSKWIVIAAGNRAEDIGFDATTIEPALANRFQHINFVPTVKRWTEWAVDKEYIDPDLIGFLNFYKDYFHRLKAEDGSMAWASPRAWSKASQFVYSLSKDFKIDEKKKKKVYTRFVGTEAAVAFIGYFRLKEKFNEKDVKDVYEKGKVAKKPPKNLNEGRAAMYSIAFYKKGEKLKPEELKNLFDYALNLDNFESKTALLSFIKMAHTVKGETYLKVDEPYKSIWWEGVKKWYEEVKSLGKEKEFKDGIPDGFGE